MPEYKHSFSELLTCFISEHEQQLTELRIDRDCWTRLVSGVCVGRVQYETPSCYSYAPGWSLAVKPRILREFAATLGFKLNRLKFLRLIKQRTLNLTPDGRHAYVWVIPLLDHVYTQRGASAVAYNRHR